VDADHLERSAVRAMRISCVRPQTTFPGRFAPKREAEV
jgi:hypothetical protein